VWLSPDSGRSWAWQESTASFGGRMGAASVQSASGVWLLLGGVDHGQASNDVFLASLPSGNPSADGGVLGGILGVALGILVALFLMQKCLDAWRDKQRIKRLHAHHQLPQDMHALDAGQEHNISLPESADGGHGGGGH